MTLRIAVCVAQVGLLADEAAFTPDGLAVDPDYLDPTVNEWDTYAIEEALRLREAHGGEVVAVTAGTSEAEPVLRRALAMGVDRAIRTSSPSLSEHPGDPLVVGGALAAALAGEAPDLVLCGMQTSDGGSASTGTATGAYLGMPVETCVIQVDWLRESSVARVTRELEGGVLELREVQTPAVLTIQSGINQPRYVTFRAIKQAEQHEIETIDAPAAAAGATMLGIHRAQQGQSAEMLEGGTAEIAERLVTIVQERLAR